MRVHAHDGNHRRNSSGRSWFRFLTFLFPGVVAQPPGCFCTPIPTFRSNSCVLARGHRGWAGAPRQQQHSTLKCAGNWAQPNHAHLGHIRSLHVIYIWSTGICYVSFREDRSLVKNHLHGPQIMLPSDLNDLPHVSWLGSVPVLHIFCPTIGNII